MALLDDIRDLVGQRSELVDDLVAQLEKAVGAAQRTLFDNLTTTILDALEREGGIIKNTARNRALLNAVDRVFDAMETGASLDVAKEIVRGAGEVLSMNTRYFNTFTPQAKLIPITQTVANNVRAWLGMGKRGKLEEGGYLKTLIQDNTLRNQVKNFTISAVMTQQGYESFKRGLRDFIKGADGKLGAMEKYYRNYAYDVYSQIDASASDQTAVRLGMDYAIYEGGLIATSRTFCRDRNGKVFSREEIMKFDPTEAKPPNYNPIRDRGGYGCRHHYNWIPYDLAVILRPDLAEAA